MLQIIANYLFENNDDLKTEDYLKSYHAREVLSDMSDHMKTDVFCH